MMKRWLGVLAVGLLTVAASAQWSNPANDIPAYNAAPPTRPLPAILSGNQLSGPFFVYPFQTTVYKMAARIPAVLHQQPCYCRCDLEAGHNSLHSCFESTHGASCKTCMQEAAYAYQQTRLGRTPAQIRAAIERGEWQSVDLNAVKL